MGHLNLRESNVLPDIFFMTKISHQSRDQSGLNALVRS